MGYLIDEIAQYLITNGAGTALGTDVFEGYLPPDPDVAYTILDTSGRTPSIYVPLKNPTFQVLIRDVVYNSGKDTLNSIFSLLHNFYMNSFIVNGIFVLRCNAVSQGGHIGQDPKGRDLFSINFETETR